MQRHAGTGPAHLQLFPVVSVPSSAYTPCYGVGIGLAWRVQVFLEQGLLSQEQLDSLLVSEFNPVRMGFQGIAEITTRDVLNCGVAPKALLEAMKRRFLGAGG